MKYACLALLVLSLSCSDGEKTTSGRSLDPTTAPFTEVEATFIRWLFSGSPRGWQAYPLPGTTALMVPAVESFRNHPQEVLPVLVSGWESGWRGYPWKSEDSPPFYIAPHNSDLLQAILCLAPQEAEGMLARFFKGEGSKMEERLLAIKILYWRLHSPKWKELLEPLAAKEEGLCEFIYVAYCAQENDSSALKTAERMLEKRASKNPGVQSTEMQCFVYQLRGDALSLKKYFERCQDPEYAFYPLWALIYMNRDDLVQELAAHSPSKEKRDLARRTLSKAEEWRRHRSTTPCDTDPVSELMDTMPARRYGFIWPRV